MHKARSLTILTGAIAAILVMLALQLLVPGETLQQSGADGAQIRFSADRRMLVAPGGCVTVRWRVDNIESVYINGDPTVGEGFEDVCVDESTMPVLGVEFDDNTKVDFTLNIQFLILQPSTWLLVTAATLLALASLYVAVSRPSTGATTAVGQARRSTTLFSAIGMLTIGLIVTALIFELALRFYFGTFGSRWQRQAYLATRAEIEAEQSPTLPLPFVEYGLTPGYPGHNTLGYRGDEIAVPKPAGVFRIVSLGDSVTYGISNSVEETYSYRLQQVLRGEYGYANVEVVNGGVTGYTSWNTLVTLALRVVQLQPDLVIVYEGGNDIGPRQESPECYSSPSPFLGLNPNRVMRAEPEPLSPSALYRFIAINLGWMPNPALSDEGYAGTTSVLTCPNTTNDSDREANVAVNPPVYFEENVRNMAGIAQVNGFPILFVTYAYDPNGIAAGDYWRAAVAEHNAITRRIAQTDGALLLDYAQLRPTEPEYWFDSVHMTDSGSQYFANTLAQFLVDEGVLEGSNN